MRLPARRSDARLRARHAHRLPARRAARAEPAQIGDRRNRVRAVPARRRGLPRRRVDGHGRRPVPRLPGGRIRRGARRPGNGSGKPRFPQRKVHGFERRIVDRSTRHRRPRRPAAHDDRSGRSRRRADHVAATGGQPQQQRHDPDRAVDRAGHRQRSDQRHSAGRTSRRDAGARRPNGAFTRSPPESPRPIALRPK